MTETISESNDVFENCEFCGAKRGYLRSGEIVFPFVKPCDCSGYQKQVAEERAAEEAERKAEEEWEARKRIRRNIEKSGMGERFLQRTFSTFKTETPSQKKTLATAMRYADTFDTMLPKRGAPLPGKNGLCITGPKGTGKTHIAASIANHLLGKGVPVICMNERSLFDRIKKTYTGNREDESSVQRMFETAPLLIIDDLGKEKASEWTVATLYAIIDGRYERAMPTIITSNYAADALITRITPLGEDITTAEALIDRIKEMCWNVAMTGESWRTRKEQ